MGDEEQLDARINMGNEEIGDDGLAQSECDRVYVDGGVSNTIMPDLIGFEIES